MRILVACEFSGRVRDAFLKKGHDAWSCDLLPTEVPGPHIEGDVLEILDDKWDMLIGHPTCTYLANSGVTHLHHNIARWVKLFEAAEFFNRLQDASIPLIALENPIPHKYAKALIGKYTQVIQPWMFGHLEQKATCLWLKGLPRLVSTKDVKTEMLRLPKNESQRLHYLPPTPDRWKLRSTTFQGIADAMADQWG